ncbi:MAG: alkaline phosphatase family protein [Gemmatimonadota bacterium]|nr:alkaline phosphatase family protein [Gemmatimonadota bacterium]
MRRKFFAPVLASIVVAALAVACNGAAGDATGTGGAVTPSTKYDRVILVSIDGLRGDAFVRSSVLASLIDRGAWTDSMRTVVPSMTVPGHLAMLTGRDVTTFGIRDNTFDAGTGATLALHAASSVFDWAKTAGKHSKAVIGAILVPLSARQQAQQFFVLDTLIGAQLDVDDVADQAIAVATSASPPEILFVHFSDVDLAGHDLGWLSPALGGGEVLNPSWLAAVAHVDAAIGRLWTAIKPSVDAGTTALIITADHGGGKGEGCVAGDVALRQHCTSNPGDVFIPFIVVGKGIVPRRLAPNSRLTQVAATVAKLLGVGVPVAADVPLNY